LNGQNLTIGITAIAFYAFSSTPTMFEATASIGLSTREAVSWYVAVFMTAATASLALSWRYRMPIAVGWSLPGLVFLTASATTYSHAELMGGVMIAGLGIAVLGAAGVADRIVQWVPMPIVMGVFAGTVLQYVVGIFDNLDRQPAIVGAAVAGYFGALALRRPWLPPMAAAFVAGIGAALLAGELHTGGARLTAPQLHPLTPAFDLGASIGVGLPLIVMAIAMGNVQGFGILRNQGFRPPIRVATIAMGLTTIANAGFGGHISTLQTNGTAIMAGPEAGPKDHRYMSTIIGAVGCVALVVAAGSLGALMDLFPAGLMPALAGLAVMAALNEGIRKSVGNELPLSGFIAMMIAASSFEMLSIGSAFWAFAGATILAIVVERDALRRYYRGDDLQ
jgi:benzoate membrane transport protein